MTERDADNRRIAEWLGWRLDSAPVVSTIHNAHVENWIDPKDNLFNGSPPDFYTDESANAMLLEAMPYAHLVRLEAQLWSCMAYEWHQTVLDADRKTAICEAFIAWKEKP